MVVTGDVCDAESFRRARMRATASAQAVIRREPLFAGRSVPDLLGLAKCVHRFLDGQEDGRFERTERTAASDRQRNRGHRYVVGGLPQVVAVVGAEGVPEAVELPADPS